MKGTVSFYLKMGLFLIIIVSIQSSSILSIFEIHPDLILIVAILFNLKFGDYKGMWFGFLMGLLEDTLTSTFLGLNSFVLTFLSWFLSFYKSYIFVNDLFSFSLFLILFTVVKYCIYMVFYLIFHREFLEWFLIIKLSGEILYNLICGALLYIIAPFFFRRKISTL